MARNQSGLGGDGSRQGEMGSLWTCDVKNPVVNRDVTDVTPFFY